MDTRGCKMVCDQGRMTDAHWRITRATQNQGPVTGPDDDGE